MRGSEVLIPSEVTQQVALAGEGLRGSVAMVPAYDVLIPGCSLGSQGFPQFVRPLGGEMVDLGPGAPPRGACGAPSGSPPPQLWTAQCSLGAAKRPLGAAKKATFLKLPTPQALGAQGGVVPPRTWTLRVTGAPRMLGALHGQGSQSPRVQGASSRVFALLQRARPWPWAGGRAAWGASDLKGGAP